MKEIPQKGNCETEWGKCGPACIHMRYDVCGDPDGCAAEEIESYWGKQTCPSFCCDPEVLLQQAHQAASRIQEALERACRKHQDFRDAVVEALAGEITEDDLIAHLDDIEKHRLAQMRRRP